MRPLEVLHKSIETNKLGHAILLESKNCKTLVKQLNHWLPKF